jgi:ATPase subunit of ABC transporter with duplicated ATPase domains
VTDADIAAKRTRLAEVDAALVRLRAQYDVLMNAFKFDEARALVGSIEATERERVALAAVLPTEPVSVPTPYVVARRRGRR